MSHLSGLSSVVLFAASLAVAGFASCETLGMDTGNSSESSSDEPEMHDPPTGYSRVPTRFAVNDDILAVSTPQEASETVKLLLIARGEVEVAAFDSGWFSPLHTQPSEASTGKKKAPYDRLSDLPSHPPHAITVEIDYFKLVDAGGVKLEVGQDSDAVGGSAQFEIFTRSVKCQTSVTLWKNGASGLEMAGHGEGRYDSTDVDDTAFVKALSKDQGWDFGIEAVQPEEGFTDAELHGAFATSVSRAMAGMLEKEDLRNALVALAPPAVVPPALETPPEAEATAASSEAASGD